MTIDRLRPCAAYSAAYDLPPIDEVRGDIDLEKQWVLSTFCEYLDQGDTEDEGWALLIPYLNHCGLIGPLEDLLRGIEPTFSLEELVLPHYALPGGGYDLERVVQDYVRQPKMRKALAEHVEKAEHRRRQKAESKRRRREARRGEETVRRVATQMATSRRQDVP